MKQAAPVIAIIIILLALIGSFFVMRYPMLIVESDLYTYNGNIFSAKGVSQVGSEQAKGGERFHYVTQSENSIEFKTLVAGSGDCEIRTGRLDVEIEDFYPLDYYQTKINGKLEMNSESPLESTFEFGLKGLDPFIIENQMISATDISVTNNPDSVILKIGSISKKIDKGGFNEPTIYFKLYSSTRDSCEGSASTTLTINSIVTEEKSLEQVLEEQKYEVLGIKIWYWIAIAVIAIFIIFALLMLLRK